MQFLFRNDLALQSCAESITSSPLSAPSTSRPIAEILGKPYNSSRVSATEMQENITRQFQHAIIESHNGETESRIAKLLGTSDNDAMQEFLTFVVQLGSNCKLTGAQTAEAENWISNQTQLCLEGLIELQDQAVQACLETLLNYSNGRLNEKVFNALLIADRNRRLYRGRRSHLLYAAIEMDLIDAVTRLVNEGIDVNTENQNFREWRRYPISNTLLGAASSVGVARILIRAGADVDAPVDDHEGITPVVCAAQAGKVDLFQLFLNAGAYFEILKADSMFDEPNGLLASAIDNEDCEMVEMLLDLGTECSDHPRMYFEFEEGKDPVKRTELQQASYTGEIAVVRALLTIKSGLKSLQSGHYRWAPLRDAAMEGHLAIVELLISAGADVDATSEATEDSIEEDAQGVRLIPSSALMAAVEAGDSPTVDCLLRHGADANAPAIGTYGTNILAVAEIIGNLETEKLLRGAGARYQPDTRHMIANAQFAAARQDHHKVQQICALGLDAAHLLDTSERTCEQAYGRLRDVLATFVAVCGRQQINARGPVSHRCAIELAIELYDVTLLRELHEAGASFKENTSQGLSLLQYALVRGSSHELINCLLSYGASTNAPAGLEGSRRVGTALEIAATDCDQETFERILLSDDRQMNDACTSNIFVKAICNGRIGLSTIQLLLNSGADANASAAGISALQAAVSRPNISFFDLLRHREAVSKPARPESCGTAVQAAGIFGSIEMVKLLLSRGADINAPAGNYGSRTALQAAVQLDSFAIAKLLLDRGADINAVPAPTWGRTALQAAIDQDSPDTEILSILLDYGADVNVPAAMNYGITALQAAASKGHLNIALKLLNMGADPNSPGSLREGRTALEGAAEHGRLDMAQLLLNAGASPTQNAMYLAERERHYVLADMIKAALKEKEANEQSNAQREGKEVVR